MKLIDYAAEFEKYLQRWCALFGDQTVGNYGICNSNNKWQWYGVVRMTKPQFVAAITEYEKLRGEYWLEVNNNMHAADTIAGRMYPLEIRLIKYPGKAGSNG